MIDQLAIGLAAATSVLLFLFGLNILFLTWRALRLPASREPDPVERDEPLVCVQLPIYNERYVAERILGAALALDWPAPKLEIQVLDDSDDETTSILARQIARARRKGLEITHVRREGRSGFKAGALAHGLSLTSAPYIAIFDADFVPPRDFLRRTIAAFDRHDVGFVQARWGHLDEGYSWFTRLQALAIDYHFFIEQAVRSASGYFTNFTGTAGVWRRDAIIDAGGWSARTLTEDLDISYRAQLRGWKAAYLPHLVVPEELPVAIDAYRNQQSRWATGSFQAAFRLLFPVLRSKQRVTVKVQAVAHLFAYGVGPVMLLQLACYPALLVAFGWHGIRMPVYLIGAWAFAVLVGFSPWFGFIVAQRLRGKAWWTGAPSFACQLFGAGMSLNSLISLGLAFRAGGQFVRTPKYRIERPHQEWRDRAYVRVGNPRALIEAALGLGSLGMIPFALTTDQWFIATYSAVFAVGFVLVAAISALDLIEVLTLRSLGRNALGHVRRAAPLGALLAVCGLLLLLAARMPEPFEDGYGHWLLAANLASTGSLHDPLFAMEDTWLPAYHVLAAIVLRVFGLWQLGALKMMSALFGFITLACVYRMASSARQGRIAVTLLVLNPVFLFTSGSAVIEPFLTALLSGAALAAAARRMKIAAALAALACAASTKAWIWVGAAAGLILLDLVRRRASVRSRVPALSWAVPAVAVLLFVQMSYGPASHSLTRGSIELLSATTRGSVPASAGGRFALLASTYGLAALPLAALAPLGLWNVLRRKSPLLTFLYVPSLVYLAAVLGLVAAGAYTGSHRYLYPALPALALLAAQALDRYSLWVGGAMVAASGLLTVAFLPVFSGFAADNSGLIAAGMAAATEPGVLVTDSPVAAYFSGKVPDQITGSQAMPLDRSQAMAWMKSRGVSVLVIEDISYYRAAIVFPDLAAGSATPPFAALGEQASYVAAGGKTVYAYRFGAGLFVQSLFPGVSAAASPSSGEGKTTPLAKGVTLRVGGNDATGEGMGFGVPIALYPDGWVYPRTVALTDLSTPGQTVWSKTFQLDEIGGDAAHDYRFAPIVSRGAVEVTYTVHSGGITVTVTPLWLAPGVIEIGVLNEQSSAFSDLAAAGLPSSLIGPDFARWVPVDGGWARLRSASLGVEWSVPTLPGAQLHGGREAQPPAFDWAGLDYIFPAQLTSVTYEITVQEAR